MSEAHNQQTWQCECHDCTQARYRQSFQFQLDSAMRNTHAAGQPDAPKGETPLVRWEPNFEESYMQVKENGEWVRFLDMAAQPAPAAPQSEAKDIITSCAQAGHPCRCGLVNPSNAELVEALQATCRWIKELADSGDAGFFEAKDVKEWVQGQAALAKAEEQR